MDINDIIEKLGIDFSNEDAKKGAKEAIKAIINSRHVPAGFGGGNGSSAAGGSSGTDIEIDPDLLQPSVKQNSPGSSDTDTEFNDPDNVMDDIKINKGEDDLEQENSDTSASNDKAGDSSGDSDEQGDNNENPNEGSTDAKGEAGQKADGGTENSTKTNKDNNSETDDIADDDLVDPEFDKNFEDTARKKKREAREIKKERTVAVGNTAIGKATQTGLDPEDARVENIKEKIQELENLDLNSDSLTDDEFDRAVNDVLDAIDGAIGTNAAGLSVKSDDERKAQVKAFNDTINSEASKNAIEGEDADNIRAETQKITARAAELAKYAPRSAGSFEGFEEFLRSLERALALQTQARIGRTASWASINRRYDGTGILRPGNRRQEMDQKAPVIDFYFDQSGSWGALDIKKGEEAIAKIKKLDDDGKIKLNIYYFADNVSSSATDKIGTGTRAWNEIVKNIIANRSDNVVIMTDSDMDDWWYGPTALSYKVPGCVWYLWRDGENAPRLPRDLTGAGGTYQYSFTTRGN